MPMPAAPRERRLLRDEVYDSIHNAIIDGTLEPGETLRDDDLMKWLGVSRTPIRQALNRLDDVGLVDMAPGRYTRVSQFDASLVNQATFTTGILHEFAARQVVATLSTEWLDELDHQLSTAKRARDSEDLPTLGPAIGDFFLVFERATRNEVLVRTVEQLSPVLLRFLTPRDSLVDLDAILTALDSIAQAAHAHDPVGTVEIIHALYEPTRKNFLEGVRPNISTE
jgi:DNA-binding GntR family transcriptional regulator